MPCKVGVEYPFKSMQFLHGRKLELLANLLCSLKIWKPRMGDTLFTSLSQAIDMGLATKQRLEEAAGAVRWTSSCGTHYIYIYIYLSIYIYRV